MTVNFLRTMILYIVIVIAVRIMGKRQIGELSPTELVITDPDFQYRYPAD